MSVKLGKRIMIVGSSGSGKSTLARQLGKILCLPVIHIDKEFWQSGWVKTPKIKWHEKHNRLVSAPEWIMDGNNASDTMEKRLERADTVIFIDFNRFVCLCSALKRRRMYSDKTRPDVPEGCPETFSFELIKYIWQFPAKWRPIFLDKISKYKHIKLIHIKNRKILKRFINDIP